MYSFSKTRHDANWREFKQCHFLRGRKDLLPLIKRKTQMSHRGPPVGDLDEGSTGPGGGVVHVGSLHSLRFMDGDGEVSDGAYSGGSGGADDGSRQCVGRRGSGSPDDGHVLCSCAGDLEVLKTRVGTLETQLWLMSLKYNDVLTTLDRAGLVVAGLDQKGRERGMSTGSGSSGPTRDTSAEEMTSYDSRMSRMSHPDGGGIDTDSCSSSTAEVIARGLHTPKETTPIRSVDSSSSSSSGGDFQSTSIESLHLEVSAVAATSLSEAAHASIHGHWHGPGDVKGGSAGEEDGSSGSSSKRNSMQGQGQGTKEEQRGLNAIAAVASLQHLLDDAAVRAANSLVDVKGGARSLGQQRPRPRFQAESSPQQLAFSARESQDSTTDGSLSERQSAMSIDVDTVDVDAWEQSSRKKVRSVATEDIDY